MRGRAFEALRRPLREFFRRRRRLLCRVAGSPRTRRGRNAISRTTLVGCNKGSVVAGTRAVPCLKRRATCLWNPLRSRRRVVGCAQWVEEKEQEATDQMALSQAVPQTGDETRS